MNELLKVAYHVAGIVGSEHFPRGELALSGDGSSMRSRPFLTIVWRRSVYRRTCGMVTPIRNGCLRSSDRIVGANARQSSQHRTRIARVGLQ